MRKVISILLVFVMCLGFGACSRDPYASVKNDLSGRWTVTYPFYESINVSLEYDFNSDGTFTVKTAFLGDLSTNGGTYLITDGVIELSFQEGSDYEKGQLKYTYENGALVVYANGYAMKKG